MKDTLQFPLIQLSLTASTPTTHRPCEAAISILLPTLQVRKQLRGPLTYLGGPAVSVKVRPLTHSCLCLDFGKGIKWGKYLFFLAFCSRVLSRDRPFHHGPHSPLLVCWGVGSRTCHPLNPGGRSFRIIQHSFQTWKFLQKGKGGQHSHSSEFARCETPGYTECLISSFSYIFFKLFIWK